MVTASHCELCCVNGEEAVVNSCPFTTETLGVPLSPLPLSSRPFLLVKPSSFSPLQESFNERVSNVAGGAYSIIIADDFWNRWSREYLQILQLRQKWTHKRRNFKEGDIALLKDNNSCRNKWPMT